MSAFSIRASVLGAVRIALTCGALVLLSRCSAASGDDIAGPDLSGFGGGASLADAGEASSFGGSDAGGITTDACVNLACQQVSCPAGTTTSVSGTVVSPAKIAPGPLPNVHVYVPNAPLTPFPDKVGCMRCDQEISGSPIAVTVSQSDGSFVLENVPVGTDIPLVIQTGRWRRQVTIPNVDACADTPLPNELTRLPRNQSEGDIPRIALQTGRNDTVECTLAKIVDVNEITGPGGTGRIHLYRGNGSDMQPSLPDGSTLWGNLDELGNYDLVVMPCSGGGGGQNGDAWYLPDEPGIANLKSFADMGGRLFLTHAGGAWLHWRGKDKPLNGPEPFPGVAVFDNQPDPQNPLASVVDQTFPKGQIFAQWLVTVGGSTTLGALDVSEPQWFVDSVSSPAQRWVYSQSPQTIQHFTFNTPLSASETEQCGRVLYSNFHVSGGGFGTFPGSCKNTSDPLSSNERIVEYMLFDTTACVQSDQAPVQ